MPQSTSTTYIAPETLRRLEARRQMDFSRCRGDSYCRGRCCRPPLDRPIETTASRYTEYGLIAGLIGTGAILAIASAYHG